MILSTMLGNLPADSFGLAIAKASIVLMVIMIAIGLGLYVYTALAWQTIARKLGYSKPWLAWIPIANFFLFPILAKKKWTWGFILLLPFAFSLLIKLFSSSKEGFNVVLAIIILLMFLSLLFIVAMSVIWKWKIYQYRNYPGWLAILPVAISIVMLPFSFFPFIGIFFALLSPISQLIILGLVAWKDREN